jgi:DnaJ-class molecular chaperone
MNPDTEQPIRYITCPECEGSGTNAHELPSSQRWVRSSEIHECYTCEGAGEIEESAEARYDRRDEAKTQE